MSEKPRKVSKNDLRNSQFGGAFVNVESADANQIGSEIHNYNNVILNQQADLTPQEYRNRQALLTKVKNFWVKGVLEKSLYNQVEFGLEERPDAIANPWSMILDTGDNSPQPLPSGTKIIEIFDEIGAGSLLILGEPGAGKTTTLLELTRDLIARAEQNTNLLIPVVFNLSSWVNKRQKIEYWLAEELNIKYDVPKKIAQVLITQQKLLPLLDGLDEVNKEYRDNCIVALNQFKTNYGVELVVCSRIKDYEALSNRLKFQSAVYIKELTLKQVNCYLKSFGKKLRSLRKLIAEDKALQELAQSPLMLNIMTLTYQGVAVEDLPKTEVIEERKKQLFDDYIEKMFNRIARWKGIQIYSKAKTKYWLSWLAQNMLRESQTVFLIEQIQPILLKKKSHRFLYKFGLMSFLGLVCGLILVLFFPRKIPFFFASSFISGMIPGLLPAIENSLLRALASGLVFALMMYNLSNLVDLYYNYFPDDNFNILLSFTAKKSFSLIGGLIFGLLVTQVKQDIEVTHDLKWSYGKAYFNIFKSTLIGMLFGVFFAFTDLGNILRFYMTMPMYLLEPSKESLVQFTLLFGITFAIIAAFFGGIEKISKVDATTKPNQGIRKSVVTAIFTGVLGFLGGWIAAQWFPIAIGVRMSSSFFSFPLILGIACSLVGGLINAEGSGIVCIQHFFLRFILYCNNKIPWNYARFLDYAAERIFLQKVGGGYIFIHRMLMEHFAQMTDK
ncbi:MAG: NACHT domain-containing protein [Okeania sp. SIO3I5]|uniref:NACHT domain-containing protein n=1 Tax=Okeania sp. SIO3I5 TaxID=2607805 RepID=UPI0013BA3807|nr:NACHT domain-containing protein [Okeania sp. SIO3I5]NEQ38525.1 NACHT domain-containing protein [Okeania sp. SIO3I5]